ncbi:DUF5330 domain-containing protein [Roseibium aestuarii]|uniref:DUF5330 domain-containing protein n=1 Tax=Roseibium aestuarii TaxID=2600299 RepID=A0ABW4JTA0_9HYPH|nr:DUF5330 domain-containing protein [Roseibium aestuarii]
MFFLLRTAFWLTLVLALIPLGMPQVERSEEAAGIDPVSAFFAAQATVSDIGGFCSRNPQACETGGQALSAIGSQAAVGAGIVLDYLDRTFFDGTDRSGLTLPRDVAAQTPLETLPAPELSASGTSSPAGTGRGETFVTGSLPAGPADARSPGTLTSRDLAMPWTGAAAASGTAGAPAPVMAAQRGPIGPLPKPNPRAGSAGRGAGTSPDKV